MARIGQAVIALSMRSGLAGWRIADVVARTWVSSRTLYKYFPATEYLLFHSLLSRYGPEFAELFDVGRETDATGAGSVDSSGLGRRRRS